MSSSNLKYSIPKITIPKNDFLNRGITTRVMNAKKLVQLQKDLDDKNMKKRVPAGPTRFLLGTPIPNSTIRAIRIAKATEEVKKEESVPSLKISEETLNREVEKIIPFSEIRGLERMRKKILHGTRKNPGPFEDKKEKKWTSILRNQNVSLPESKRRRSTVESIKNAIENSPSYVKKLVNADSIERKTSGRFFTKVLENPLERNIRPRSYKRERLMEELETRTSLMFENFLLQMYDDKTKNINNRMQ